MTWSSILQSLWVRCSEMLSPLTNLVGECEHTKHTRAVKSKWKPWNWNWDSVHQTAFDNVTTIITKDVVLSYPDNTQEFKGYMDSSKFQLGAVIKQNKRPLAFLSRKLKRQSKNAM